MKKHATKRQSTSPIEQEKGSEPPEYINVLDLRPADDLNTCLRPLGLCDLGGCCNICWYNPEHPRFKKHD
jgi:hypothetical protein